MPLVLASTSVYRRELLARLGLEFHCARPDTDESPLPGESATQLVKRLARDKARSVAASFSDSIIIGSDQVATADNSIVTKPGSHENAVAQLQAASGRKVVFHTGLCVINTADDSEQLDLVPFTVHFRKLSDSEIENYVRREQPLDCAGSFKSEGLGIALFERMEGDDPTALIGLPLIRLTDMLRQAGLPVL